MVTTSKLNMANCYDKQVYEIAQSDFILMINAVKSFNGTPEAVYLRHAGKRLIQFLTLTKFQSLEKDYNASNPKPTEIWLNKPAVAPIKEPVVPAKPKPETWIYALTTQHFTQDTSTDCGDDSMAMGLTKLFPGIGDLQDTLKIYAGTTSQGTSHEGLKNAFLKEMELKGLKGSYSEMSIEQMTPTVLAKLLQDPNSFVIAHGNTGGWKPPWINSYGHYVYPNGINMQTGQYNILDPTKKEVIYSKTEFEAGLKLITNQNSYLIFTVER